MKFSLFFFVVGFASIAFHELLYRRFTPDPEQDLELGNLITHAGIDMGLMLGFLLTIVVIHDLNHHKDV